MHVLQIDVILFLLLNLILKALRRKARISLSKRYLHDRIYSCYYLELLKAFYAFTNSMKTASVAQWVRAFGSIAEGWVFESQP